MCYKNFLPIMTIPGHCVSISVTSYDLHGLQWGFYLKVAIWKIFMFSVCNYIYHNKSVVMLLCELLIGRVVSVSGCYPWDHRLDYRHFHNFKSELISSETGFTQFRKDYWVAILKYNYLFWLITIVPFKIDLKSFPLSALVSINTSSAKDRYF